MPALLFAVVLAVEVVGVALSWQLEPLWDTVLNATYGVSVAAAGALIVTRYPRHRIGWLFIVTSFAQAATDVVQGWGLRAAPQHWPAGPFAEWVAVWSWILGGPALVFLFLLFPDGHLTRRRWAAIAWANVVGAALLLPGWGLSPHVGELFIGGRNPYAIDAAWRRALEVVGMWLFLGSVAASVGPLVQRLRHATGIERLQLRWFAFASLVATVTLPAVALLWTAVPAIRPLGTVAPIAITSGAAIGILRYRLYDIDLVISRTLTYVVLSVLVAGTYAAAVVAIGAGVGRGTAWSTAGATLAAAVVFGSLRHRVQDAVDRQFNRARFDAVQQVARFVDELRSGRAAPEDIEGVLRSALDADDLTLELFLPGGEGVVDPNGNPVADDPADGRSRWPIRHAGTTLGLLVAPAELSERGSLVPAVLDAGVLAVEIARLRVGLRRQLDEVEASRARIVAAGDDERRRIERDLHDGAQQRLVSIGLALRHAQHALGPNADPDVNRTLDDAVAEITVTIDELRELARGLRPAHLDAGLGAALRDLARRAPLPVQVVTDADRYPTDIETAAYFTACEGLTNAVKHASATTVELRAIRERQRLVVAIIDDGIGGASVQRGSGLAGLADRVAAHGGTLSIDSDTGRGTRIRAEFPCAS